MSEFRRRVYAVAAKIPKGKVMTYGQLAAKAGNPRAARAVGMCMKQNPDLTRVPCHRVVASDGELTGYSPRLTTNNKRPTTKKQKLELKKKMLLKEGVKFKGERVDLARSGWRA